jgi:hypothetical protein
MTAPRRGGFQTLEYFAIGKGKQPKGGFAAKALFATITDPEKLERKTENVADCGALRRNVV